MKVPLGSFSNIRTGDCIVTFSRREIYRLKVVVITLLLFFYVMEDTGVYDGSCKSKSYFQHFFS